jgi:formylglycine-generating enzyme required for sulfatase activity
MEGLSVAYVAAGRPYRTGDDGRVICVWHADGYRLPSQAEWEWAALGGVKSCGFEYAGGDDLGAVGWYSENSGGFAHQVGQKAPNELGLFDMSGNVWEWCWDLHTAGEYRARRGGSWNAPGACCRAALRDQFPYNSPGRYFCGETGLRLARAPSR